MSLLDLGCYLIRVIRAIRVIWSNTWLTPVAYVLLCACEVVYTVSIGETFVCVYHGRLALFCRYITTLPVSVT